MKDNNKEKAIAVELKIRQNKFKVKMYLKKQRMVHRDTTSNHYKVTVVYTFSCN